MSNKPKRKEAVLFLQSQPPHIGEAITILNNINFYDHMYLCICGKPSIIPLQKVLALWTIMLQHFKHKISVTFISLNPNDFTSENYPAIIDDRLLLTCSQKEFTHLSSLGYPVKLLPRVMGFHPTFLRAAYRQSRALDWLIGGNVNATHNTKFEKLEKEMDNIKEGN